MSNELKLIIQRLKDCIDKSGISYVELGKRTGTAKSSIQRYANGETRKIPVDFIITIAPILNVTPAYLMGWEEKEESPVGDDRDSEIINMFAVLSDEEKKSVLDYILFVISKRK